MEKSMIEGGIVEDVTCNYGDNYFFEQMNSEFGVQYSYCERLPKSLCV